MAIGQGTKWQNIIAEGYKRCGCGTDECTNIRAGRLALVHGLSVVAAAVAAVGDEAGVVVSHDLLADCRACSSAEVCLLVLTGDDDDDRYSPITESCITHTHTDIQVVKERPFV